MRNVGVVVFVLCMVLISCNDNLEIVKYQRQLVVEGSIENNKHASVLLSHSASFTGAMDTTSLLNHVIKNAKVSVSNGLETEILLLKTNKHKIPPYEYVTTEMKGEVGKKYFLKIEYYDELITAETYIPEPATIDRLWFKKKYEDDDFGHVHIAFKNTSDDYYQLSTQIVSEEDVFYPCLYGNIDKKLYGKGEEISMQINRGPVIFPESSYITHFPADAHIRVKLSTQAEDSYRFWTSYQNEILNSQNPIFPSTNRLVSNIKGGVGVWSGYGSSIGNVNY